jgi:cytochrome b-561
MSRVFVPVPLFVFFQLLSVFPSALLVLWMSQYRGGFSWNGNDENCNWHPVFMVTGHIYFLAQAITAFRVLPFTKRVKKFIHGCLHASGVTCSGVGIFAIFTTHQKQGHDHLYSLHSWCGIIAVGLFVLQV